VPESSELGTTYAGAGRALSAGSDLVAAPLAEPAPTQPGRRVVAIDGPAGSGKSTVAKAVASRLGIAYLDTGAMYRAVAFTAIRRGVDPEDRSLVAKIARELSLEVGERVMVDGVDATIEIRSPEVTRAVSVVAANPEVRKELVRRQREWGDQHGAGVVEGRDIGTVVFPEAPVKVYLTASDEERAQRRSQEMLQMNYDEVAADIARRDHIDSTRADAPLAVAPGAVVIDTTSRTVDQVVEMVLGLAQKAGFGPGCHLPAGEASP
jgi:cytidylate kinase